MKLQVKDSGAWRNVLSFERERMADVEATSAALLAAACCSKTTMRICDGDRVVSRCEPPARMWRLD